MQTWENLIFAVVWMKLQIHSLPLGAAFGALKAHKTALNEIDQSPQISVKQRRGLEILIIEQIIWESLSK